MNASKLQCVWTVFLTLYTLRFQWKYLSNVVPWIRHVKDDARQLDDFVKVM